MANVDPPLLMAAYTLVRKGDVIWDIGANVGLFSLAAAAAIALKWEGVEEQHVVAAFNLDWLLSKLPIPDIVKIDVEGAELEVLSNQGRMLNEVRPLIVCEVGSNAAEEITALLTSASYLLFDGEKPLRGAQNVNCATWSTIAIPEEKRHWLR